MEFFVKLASLIVNTLSLGTKVFDLVLKLKEKHQKNNRPTKE